MKLLMLLVALACPNYWFDEHSALGAEFNVTRLEQVSKRCGATKTNEDSREGTVSLCYRNKAGAFVRYASGPVDRYERVTSVELSKERPIQCGEVVPVCDVGGEISKIGLGMKDETVWSLLGAPLRGVGRVEIYDHTSSETAKDQLFFVSGVLEIEYQESVVTRVTRSRLRELARWGDRPVLNGSRQDAGAKTGAQ